MRPEVAAALINAAFGPTPEQKRQVILALAFVSIGCVIRRRYDYPPLTREDGDELLRQVREALP